jgi:type I restriction enzyme R subunit
VSRYDFKRSEEDGATVKLVYENRGEKLGLAIASTSTTASRRSHRGSRSRRRPEALLDKLLGKDYEVITADERLDKIATDFVEHCATRWESGKSMFVCIDKITCGRYPPADHAALEKKLAAASRKRSGGARRPGAPSAAKLGGPSRLDGRRPSSRSSSAKAQNEVADFKKWGFDIIPHRAVMKQGFETAGGKRVDVETAFKDPQHPFRVAIVCAMWLTGFDVECLSTLYIDKPMKAHTLMQAIARANRSLPRQRLRPHRRLQRHACEPARRPGPVRARRRHPRRRSATHSQSRSACRRCIEAIEATEAHLRGLAGFDPATHDWAQQGSRKIARH